MGIARQAFPLGSPEKQPKRALGEAMGALGNRLGKSSLPDTLGTPLPYRRF